MRNAALPHEATEDRALDFIYIHFIEYHLLLFLLLLLLLLLLWEVWDGALNLVGGGGVA